MHAVNNPISLDQARALDALDRRGTFAAAAKELRRGHTSVLYAIKTLEDGLGFAVLDRSGYRTRLTPSGVAVLAGCRALLAAEAELAWTVEQLNGGTAERLGISAGDMVDSAHVRAVIAKP